MRVHYRTQLNFTWEGMKEARESLGRIDDWLQRLRECSASVPLAKTDGQQAGSLPYTFEEALDDDLNISAALGFLFETIRETNRAMDNEKIDSTAAKTWLTWWERINNVLNLESETAELPIEIAKLAEARVEARLAKDFRKSDELRDQLNALGWEARDTKEGQKITRRAGA